MAYSILVAIDESEWSNAAIELALWICQRGGRQTRLTGLHVVGVTQTQGRLLEDISGMLGFEPVVVPKKVEDYYMDRGRRLVSDFEARCTEAGVEHRGVLEKGPIVDTICHHAAASDVVIIGLRGETEERVPGQGGGTAHRVVRNAQVSCLVVPRGLHTITGIALGYDASDGAGRALRAAAHLAEVCGAEVHAIHVGPVTPDDPLETARNKLGALGDDLHLLHVDGEPHEVLPATAAQVGCNVLALGYRGRSALKDIFLGRTTEWLIGRVDLGMLVAR